ncbi:hypothetical protein S40285_03052 [Stachybotrys chlorohalonatus IBT 40285]|uniref:Uncharacterized protein n=1 Tax=Stachybotrys chlorohalonatus (strain IBT 40285) TaxID=1283841 RepID=A0A084QRS6_STAC4|nr:hypothetical protein S40285_03052 [Stachybotrys chlorohalonata IBT 40285]
MPGPEKKWDAAAERDLCVALIMCNQESERVRYNWAKVHSFMQSHGYQFTRDAISQHFTKVILKDFKGRHKNGAEPATAAKSTSRKSATLSTRKRSSKKVANEDEDDDVVEEQSPSKKTKKVKEQEPTTVKLEDVVRTRERSQTILDNEEQFQRWINEDD